MFAEHGFAGASVNTIAAQASYNKSLTFQYFGDKLSLYGAVIKRADSAMSTLLVQVFTPLFKNETIITDAQTCKAFLETLTGIFFDYLVDHPRFMHMILWEQAAGWETFTRLGSELQTEYSDHIAGLFRTAYRAGWLRSDVSGVIQVSVMFQLCISYLSCIPLHGLVLHHGEELPSSAPLTHARDYIIGFIVSGILASPQNN